MKLPDEISINQFAKENAAALARKLQMVAIVVLFLLFCLYSLNHYNTKLSYLTDAVGTSMAEAIVRGDQGILNNFAASITANKDISGVWITDKRSKNVIGFSSSVFEMDFPQQKQSSFLFSHGSFYRLHKASLVAKNQGEMGTLYLAVKLPFIGALFALISLGLIFWLVFGFFISTVEKRVRRQITVPVMDMADKIKDKSILSDNNNYQSPFTELNEVLGSFQKLWREKQKSLSMAKQTLKDSVRGRIASFAAHDIRQKLHNAWGAVESLKSKNSCQREIETLTNALLGIDATVQDIRSVDLANIDVDLDKADSIEQTQKEVMAGLSQENIRPNLLIGIIEPLCREFQMKCNDKVSLNFKYEEFDLFAEVDSAKLNRVVSNLLSNAFKAVALNSGGGKIDVWLGSNSDGDPVIEVKDNGPGFAKEKVEKLFEGRSLFPNGGTGKGLVLVKENVERWMGQIEVDTAMNKGFKITITLPRAEDTGAYAPGIFLSKNSDIFVVDDDPNAINRHKKRLKALDLAPNCIRQHYFSGRAEIKEWLETHGKPENSFFLLDYRLKNEDTGAKIAKDLALESQSLIISDAWDDPETINACGEVGIPILSKRILDLVPIHISEA